MSNDIGGKTIKLLAHLGNGFKELAVFTFRNGDRVKRLGIRFIIAAVMVALVGLILVFMRSKTLGIDLLSM